MLKQWGAIPTLLAWMAGLSLTSALTPSIAAAADLQTIRQRGRLIVAVKENLRPLGFRDAAGNLVGFEVELAQRLAQELLGRSEAVEFQTVSNRDRFEVVLEDQVDLAIAQVTLTPSRLRILNFSLPYYRDGVVIATPSTAIQTVEDLAGKPVAVLNNSSTVEILRRRFPSIQLISAQSYQDAKAQIDRGQAIAIAADASVLAGWVQEFPTYRLLPSLLSSESLCVVMPKGAQYTELHQQVDLILSRLRQSGWLEQQAIRWGLPVGPR